MPGAYYNENDPFAADWLRNLIAHGLIADGDVDTRSIKEVTASDLAGYAQCHFFAGIGGWSYALRLAGWPDDETAWTGSCPCQPFSGAGKQKGEADERHLWPDFHRLISECNPAIVFGEQVASGLGRGWLAGVRTDLEALGYAVGAADICAAGAGAPHIRQRLYWMADAGRPGDECGCRSGEAHGAAEAAEGKTRQRKRRGADIGDRGATGRLADTDEGQRGRLADGEGCQPDRATTRWQQGDSVAERDRATGGMADAHGGFTRDRRIQRGRQHGLVAQDGGAGGVANTVRGRAGHAPGQSMGAQATTDRKDRHLSRKRLRTRLESSADGLGDTDRSAGGQGRKIDGRRHQGSDAQPWPGLGSTGDLERLGDTDDARSQGRRVGGYGPGERSPWEASMVLPCSDGKARRIAAEPALFPLVDGFPNRMGTLRGAGNAIVPQIAAIFIEAACAAIDSAVDTTTGR